MYKENSRCHMWIFSRGSGFEVRGSGFPVRGSGFPVRGSRFAPGARGLRPRGSSRRLLAAPGGPCGLPRLPRPIGAGANPQEPASIYSSWRLLAASPNSHGLLGPTPNPKSLQVVEGSGCRARGARLGSVRRGAARSCSPRHAVPRLTSPTARRFAPLPFFCG